MHQAHFVVRTLLALGIATRSAHVRDRAFAAPDAPALRSIRQRARREPHASSSRMWPTLARVASPPTASTQERRAHQVAGSPFAAAPAPSAWQSTQRQVRLRRQLLRRHRFGYTLNATTGALTSIAGSPLVRVPIRTAPHRSDRQVRYVPNRGSGSSAPMRSTRAPAP